MSGSLEPIILRPYQREIALAVLDSVFGKKGLTFSVEIARQGGRKKPNNRIVFARIDSDEAI